jgi:hypothetical protein
MKENQMSNEATAMAKAPISIETRRTLSVDEIKARVTKMRQIKKDVMQDGVHYGTIPGAGSKPTLLKAGSEVLLMAFCIAPDPIVEDLSNEDEVRYRIKCDLKDAGGNFLGAGVGEASSSEEKYKWRRAVCKEEYDETPADRRRGKWYVKDGDAQKTLQVRTNPSDVANTILKMAKKRAQVDAALTVLSASEEFTQDVEDLDPALLGNGGGASAASSSGPAPTGEDLPGLKVTDIKVLWKKDDGSSKLFGITFSDRRKATTFDEDKVRVAARAKTSRLPVEIVLVPSKSKKAKDGDMELSSIKIVEAQAAQPAGNAPAEKAAEQPAQTSDREPGGDDGELFGKEKKNAA